MRLRICFGRARKSSLGAVHSVTEPPRQAAARPPMYGRRREMVEEALRRWRAPKIAEALALVRAAEAASRTRRAPTALICAHTLATLADFARTDAR